MNCDDARARVRAKVHRSTLRLERSGAASAPPYVMLAAQPGLCTRRALRARTHPPAALPPSREGAYETLGIGFGASAEAVKRAYRRLALRLHPDVNREGGAADAFQRLRAAYESLLAGGGEQSRPLWQTRWREQLKQLRILAASKLQQLRPGAAARRAAAASAEAEEERRQRVREQLRGLESRAERRAKRRPPGQNSVWVEPEKDPAPFKDEAVQ